MKTGSEMLEARGLQAAMKLIGAWITVEAQGGTVPYRMANLIYPAGGGRVQSALSFLSKMCVSWTMDLLQ